MSIYERMTFSFFFFSFFLIPKYFLLPNFQYYIFFIIETTYSTVHLYIRTFHNLCFYCRFYSIQQCQCKKVNKQRYQGHNFIQIKSVQPKGVTHVPLQKITFLF